MRYFKICLILLFLLTFVSCQKDNDVIQEPVITEIDDLEEDVETLVEKTEIVGEVNQEQILKNDELFEKHKVKLPEPVWSFDALDKNHVWSLQSPILKPFIHEDAYYDISYIEHEEQTLVYVDERQRVKEEHVVGKYWRLSHKETSGNYDQLALDLKRFLLDAGADYYGNYENQYVFGYEDDGYWWLNITIYDNEAMFEISFEERFKVDEDLVINPSDYDGTSAYFSVVIPDGKYMNLEAQLDQGYVSIDFEMENQYGDYERQTRYYQVLDAEESKEYIIDDFLYEPGRARMTVNWTDDIVPGQIKLKINTLYDVEKIEYDEQLGGVLLSSDLVTDIQIKPTLDRETYLIHDEFNESGLYFDKNFEDAFVAYVPSGYYDLEISVSEGIISSFKTLRVPVHSGKMTHVHVPDNVTDAFKYKEAYEEHGIFINNIYENEDKVTFNFSLIDHKTRSVLPSIDNAQIYEGGMVCDIVSIEPVQTPLNIILLLDSSGSMKGQMNDTILAAKSFITGLPDDAIIKVIDFDTSAKLLTGDSKDALINALNHVDARGATALYDSVIQGLDLLEGTSRSALVVFTDGEDANLNDTGPGSLASFEETLEKVGQGEIPVYTIGFGDFHDSTTLRQFSEKSLGQYYPASNQDALSSVFEAINNRLTNTYQAVYNRPKEASVSDIPVVSLVVDISGSMEGSRMINVKNISHDFIESLPEHVQILVTGFNSEIIVQQGVTTDKLLSLNAVGGFEAGGGTNVIESVLYAYESLSRVPSSKRILIFVTDAALEDVPEEDDLYKQTLEKLKEDGIETLWVGVGIDDEVPFKNVAEYTSGDYVVTEDAALIRSKFDQMLTSVKAAKVSDETLLSLVIKKRTDNGAFESFGKSVLYALSPVKKSDQVIIQDTVKYTIDENIAQYDESMSTYVSGSSIVANETIISKRIPTHVSNKNEAMNVAVNEIIFASKLQGVEAPSGQRFMGVLMTLNHILPEQEVMVYPDGSAHPSNWVTGSSKGKLEQLKIDYNIPNFSSHFGMSYNGDGPYPAATATWLTAQPLVVPGEYDLTLFADQVKSGMMVFLVPDQPLDQLGIHFFDEDYGHMVLPVVNEAPAMDTSFDTRSNKAVKLLDNFEFIVTGYGIGPEEEFDPVESQFRLIEAAFKSDVTANLNIDPSERMLMRLKTDNGDFYLPLSPRTSHLPFGFYSPTTVMPGAKNRVKQVYQMPKLFDGLTSELYIDLADEDVIVPIFEKDSLAAGHMASFSHEYFDADVNNVFYFDGPIGGYSNNYIVADVTIHDKKDGFATSGIGENFTVGYELNTQVEASDSVGLGNFATSNYGYDGSIQELGRDESTIGISSYTSDLLLGMDSETVIYDGTSRRGIMVFEISEDMSDLYLMFDTADIKVEISSQVDSHVKGLVAVKSYESYDSVYSNALNDVLPGVIADYKLKHPQVTLTKKAGQTLYDEVNMPSINSYGYDLLEQINNEEDLIKALRSLRYLPSDIVYGYNAMFSKEAIMTQGFASEGDMAQMAVDVLSELGYKVKMRMVKTTDRGQTILKEMSGIEDLSRNELPALTYTKAGKSYMLVLPYARYLSDLEGIAYYAGEEMEVEEGSADTLSIYVDLLPTESGHLAQLNQMAGALGGSSDENPKFTEYLTSFRLPLTSFSKDAVDIGMSVIGDKAYVMMSSADGIEISESYIDLSYYKVLGWSVNVNYLTHHIGLAEDMSPDQAFVTIGYNLPDLPEDAAQVVSQYMDASKELKADTFSALKWIHRQALYNFIAAQTAFEDDLANAYDIVTGRSKRPRLIVVRSIIDDEFITSMDLLSVQNDLHTGDQDLQDSFRLISGLNASHFEEAAFANGVGVRKIWKAMPEDATLVLMDTNNFELYEDDLRSLGVSEQMIEYFYQLGDMVLIQSKPSIINDRERWAWLEIDRYTYETISVLDTFEHGTLASNATLNNALEKAQYSIGQFKGVESSIWAVSAFSLQLDDYDEIIKSAKAFALGIADNFEVQVGSVTVGIGKTPELNGTAKEIQDTFKKGKKNDSSTGFKEGYIDGVNLYFKLVELSD